MDEVLAQPILRSTLALGFALVIAALIVCSRPRLKPATKVWIWGLAFLPGLAFCIPVLSIPLPHSMPLSKPSIEPLPELVSTAGDRVELDAHVEVASSSPDTLKPNVSEPVIESSVPSNSNWRRSLRGWGVIVWMIGVISISLQQIARYVYFVATLRRQTSVDSIWSDEFASALKALNPKTRIELFSSSSTGPLVCRRLEGYMLVVPEELGRELTSEQREFVIRHELNHVTQKDVWKILLVRFIATLHWFNPLAWLSLVQFERCIEFACDDRAKGDHKAEQIAYAKTIVAISEHVPKQSRIGLAFYGSRLKSRVERVVFSKECEMSKTRMLLVGLMSVVVLVTSLQVQFTVQAQTESKTTSQEQTQKQESSGAEEQEESEPKESLVTRRYSIADVLGSSQSDEYPHFQMKATFDGKQWMTAQVPIENSEAVIAKADRLIDSTYEYFQHLSKYQPVEIPSIEFDPATQELIVECSSAAHLKMQSVAEMYRRSSDYQILLTGSVLVMPEEELNSQDIILEAMRESSSLPAKEFHLMQSTMMSNGAVQAVRLPRMNLTNGAAAELSIDELGGNSLSPIFFQAVTNRDLSSCRVAVLTNNRSKRGRQVNITNGEAAVFDLENWTEESSPGTKAVLLLHVQILKKVQLATAPLRPDSQQVEAKR